MSARDAVRMVLLVAGGIAASSSWFPAGAAQYESPAHLFGVINRNPPADPNQPWFSPREAWALSNRFDVIAGLDNNGYTFPGAIDEIRSRNPSLPILCTWEPTGHQPAGPEFAIFDRDESIFIHSADPASLTVVAHQGETILWFLQDARGLDLNRFHEPMGVTEYVVEVSTAPGQPFAAVGDPIPAEDLLRYYSLVDPVVDAERVYRVRSRAADGQLYDYSWEASVDVNAETSIAIARLFEDGSMVALCYGDNLPGPSGLEMHADLNNDRVYQPNERFSFTSVEPQGSGVSMYTGTIPPPGEGLWFSHRAVLASDPSVSAPAKGAYQSGLYNNRVQTRIFSSHMVWPDHPTFLERTGQRLTDALAAGYDGMRLDLPFDTLDLPWAASGVPPDWEGERDQRLADGIETLLTSLNAREPGAIVSINGYFSLANPDNYYRYLDHVESGEFEFFAIGHQSNSAELLGDTVEAMVAMRATEDAGRWAVALSGASERNVRGRMTAYALYLLIMGDGLYFYNETDFYLDDVVYFPEWGAPLGEPLYDIDQWLQLLDPRGDLLLARHFQNGSVFSNADDEAVTLRWNETVYRLAVTGGRSFLAGGDGRARYAPTRELTLAPGEVAIVLRIPPATPGTLLPPPGLAAGYPGS